MSFNFWSLSMNRSFGLFAAVIAFALASGGAFAQQFGGYNVGTNEARRAIPLEDAVVLDVLPLQLDKAASTEVRSAGGIIGGIVGAALGSSGGNGSWGRSAALGALGALAGDAVARHASEDRIEAIQIVIRTASGRVMAVGQEGRQETFRPGDNVYVMFGQTTRIVRASQRTDGASTSQSSDAPYATQSSYRAPAFTPGYQQAPGYQQVGFNR